MAIDQDITNLPTPPSRSDSPSDFSDKADTFLAALPQLQTELNTYADEANATQQVINTSESNAATSETNAEDWASKTDGIVLTTDYSAKAYAISDNLIPEGAAKEWAIKTGSTVDGTEFSAKKYANDAQSSADAAASLAGATAWSAGVTYDTNDAAIGSDGNTYRSLVDGNLGNDPVTGDGTKWLNLTGTADVTKAELTKTFAAGESVSLELSEEVTTAPVVSVTKEVPQTGVTSNDWDVAADGGNFTLHDTAYDTTLTPGEVGFTDVDTWSYDSVSFDVSGQELKPRDIKFNNDGTKMYIIGNDTDSIYEYNLSVGFDLITASYNNVSLSVSAEDTAPYAMAFDNNGTKMYMVGINAESVYQYTLSTAFDLTTASYDNISFDVSTEGQAPRGIEFNSDGSKMYLYIYLNDYKLFQYSLSTPFDISTASYDSVSFDTSAQTGTVTNFVFNNDGSKLYVYDDSTNSLYQYSLSSGFDITTASYENISFDTTNQESEVYGLSFNSGGTKFYLVGVQSDKVYQYSTSKEALVLGTGSFASTDVGKRIVGNGGEAILTAADGSYEEQTAFNDDSTIAAGDWSMFALDVESANAGLTLSGLEIINGFDLSTASYDSVSFDLSSQDTATYGIAFNTDGSKMYITGDSNDAVYQYSLSTRFDLSTASYDNVSFDVSGQDTFLSGIAFNSDGTQMYTVGGDTDSVYQYTLSTGFDLSTASYNDISLDVSAQDTEPFDIDFNTDGTKMYLIGASSDFVYQYTLSTAFDLSTASYDSVSFDVSGEDTNPQSVTFNTDGTKMFIIGGNSGSAHQYSLSTAFDLSTASYDSVSFDVSGEMSTPQCITFSTDGTKMYIVDSNNEDVYQYTTGSIDNFIPTNTNHTAITSASTDTEFWTDINSMTADDEANDGSVYYAVSTDDRTTWKIIDDTDGERAIVRNNDGTWEVNDASDYGSETWVAASQNDEFYALEEAVEDGVAEEVVGFVDAINWSYDSVGFDISSQEGTSRGIAFNNDGTKMYIIGRSNFVYQYTLSTTFDVSSASYDSVSFDISGQEGFPNGIAFNDDGTKMYIIGTDSKSVNQYTLSSSFDLSTTSYDSVSFSVSSEDAFPSSVTFNNDGTKMYIVGTDVDSVHEYTLGTPFDVSTASYSNIDVHGEDGDPYDIKFNNDGTKMYVLGRSGSSVNQYTLSSAFDLSTASYDNVSFDVSGQESVPYGMTFNDNGTKMYIVSDNNDTVFQYSTGTTTLTNRMDAAQLNAVSDANHYTLGDDLDLAITMTMPDGNTSSPTSDGVSINYDANVLNQGAVLGTDYEFDKPTNDTVRVTALSDENLKVRVV